jgi:hippurate hydrolase
MLNVSPGAYMRIGNGAESVHVHKPDYEFNDEIIPLGSSFLASVVETKLVKE